MTNKKENNNPIRNKYGRKKIADPCKYRYTLKLNEADNKKFLHLFEQTNLQTKAYFLYHCVFNKPIPIYQVDQHLDFFLGELTNFNRQFRSIGINYNQVVSKINRYEMKPEFIRYYFSQLEKLTVELITVSRDILKISETLKSKYDDCQNQ